MTHVQTIRGEHTLPAAGMKATSRARQRRRQRKLISRRQRSGIESRHGMPQRMQQSPHPAMTRAWQRVQRFLRRGEERSLGALTEYEHLPNMSTSPMPVSEAGATATTTDGMAAIIAAKQEEFSQKKSGFDLQEREADEQASAWPAPATFSSTQDWTQSNTRRFSKSAAAEEFGTRLDPAARKQFERDLGGDFASVRVHTREATGRQVRAAGADAITSGEHIYFAPGKFALGSPAGRALLTHELVHVRQQISPSRRAESISEAAQREPEALLHEKRSYETFSHAHPAQFSEAAAPPEGMAEPRRAGNILYSKPAAAFSHRSLEQIPASNRANEASCEPVAAESRFDTETLLASVYQSLKMKLKIEKERLGN